MKIVPERLERINVTAPMEDRQKALDWCYANDYHIKVAGPLALKNGMYDTNTFEIEAEKNIDDTDEIERLREALDWYADEANYDEAGAACLLVYEDEVEIDKGEIARQALKESKTE